METCPYTIKNNSIYHCIYIDADICLYDYVGICRTKYWLKDRKMPFFDEFYKQGKFVILGGVIMKKLLAEKIDQLRERLYKLIELYGTQNQEVLKCSQELDILICNSYIKIRSK
jgi:hypothetical protein